MKPLIPELERQLRAVVEDERKPAPTPQRRVGVVLMVVGTATALAVAVLAVILIGHGRRPRTVIPAGPAPSTRLTCGLPPRVTHRSPEGPFKTIERGAVDGHSWLLQSGQNGKSVVGRQVRARRPPVRLLPVCDPVPSDRCCASRDRVRARSGSRRVRAQPRVRRRRAAGDPRGRSRADFPRRGSARLGVQLPVADPDRDRERGLPEPAIRTSRASAPAALPTSSAAWYRRVCGEARRA